MSAVLSHWLWALPVLLIVAALATRQIDAYPPAADEFFSMFNSGYLAARPYSPLEIVESLQRQSFDHMPGFFLLLGSWGNATSHTLPMARVLPILIGILALAMIYRLARDSVAPQAGLIALVIVSGSAFYNFYYAYVRMYTLVVLLAAALLWLYFRIVYRETAPRRRDCAALGASVASLMLTHPMCVTLLTALGLYHLLLVRKDRRWFMITLSVITGIVVISPYLLVWASTFIVAYEGRTVFASPTIADVLDTVGAWVNALLNGQAVLLVLSLIGLMLGIRKRYTNLAPWLLLALLQLSALAAVAGVVPKINETALRYNLVGWLPFVMLFAGAIYCLYRFHPLLLVLALAWVAAGLWHQGEVDPGWKHRLGWQSHVYPLPPWHAVSREAQVTEPPPIVVAHVNMSFELRLPQHINYTQLEHYFTRHGVVFWQLGDLAWFDGLVNDLVISTPNLWVLYQQSKIDNQQQVFEMRDSMMTKRYELCESKALGDDSVLLKYSWRTLECSPPSLKAQHQTKLADYEFYGVALDGSTAYFIDRWSAATEFDRDRFNLSYQLLDQNWNNVAQLDLPLVHEGKFRQFSIGIADVPAGAYRLAAIMYDNRTGETIDWIDNPGFVPGIIELSEVVIEE